MDLVESSTTDTEIDPENQTEDIDTPAGAQNTDTVDGPQVPVHRLNEVIAERNSLKEQYETLQREYEEASKPKATQPEAVADPTAEEPPEHLNPTERVKWYVEKYAGSMIESKLGMPLEDARTLLAATKSVSQDFAERTWKGECEKHGLDADNVKLQKFVRGQVNGNGDSWEEVMAEAKTIPHYVKAKAATVEPGTPAPPTASVETDGVAATMVRGEAIPRTRAEATQMANKGIRAPHEPMEAIIARLSGKAN